eukprot:sb/3468852/
MKPTLCLILNLLVFHFQSCLSQSRSATKHMICQVSRGNCDWLFTCTSKQPIRTRYLGHVSGYQPIRDQYFLIRSVPVGYSLTSNLRLCAALSCSKRIVICSSSPLTTSRDATSPIIMCLFCRERKLLGFIWFYRALYMDYGHYLGELKAFVNVGKYFHPHSRVFIQVRYFLIGWEWEIGILAVSNQIIIATYQEPTKISKQPIRTRYLDHVTGYQPMGGLIRSVPVTYLYNGEVVPKSFHLSSRHV